MLGNILRLKNGENSVKEFTETLRQGIPSAVFGVGDAFKNFLVCCIDEPVLYIVKDSLAASAAVTAIKEISGKKAIYIPPKDEILLTSRAFSKDGLYERIKATDELSGADVIVATAEALMQTFPKTPESVTLETDGEADMEKIISRLCALGYTRAENAEAKGTFAARGDVLDIFAVNAEEPVRAEFFGDTVESIKKFDAENRKNLGYINCFKALPAVEFSFVNDDFGGFEKAVREELKNAPRGAYARLKIIADDIFTAMENKDAEGMNALSPLSVDCGSVFDYLKENTVVVIDEAKRVWDSASLSEREFNERYASLLKDGEIFSFSERNFTGLEGFKAAFSRYRLTALQTLSTAIPFFNPLAVINPQSGTVVNYQLDFNEVYTDIDNWLKGGYGVLACTGESRRAQRFCMDLSERGIASELGSDAHRGGVTVTDGTLSRGFIFHEEKIVVIGSGNLYVRPREAQKKRIKKKQAFFTAPAAGDYCVHETHGIGRVLGNKKISTTEGTKDYISVEYSGGDILYVPVEQLDILTRYLGAEKKPRLSKIGGADFERVKSAVRESIKKMSFDLKKLYGERNALTGFPFVSDSELEAAFGAAFPFEETADQIAADEDIKADMESEKVMERLVCGDVGFGKTEVAFRAVFRAIENGKQAAMLAPTTILTEQHYNTAVKRFEGFGIKIACLNRFRSAKEQRAIVEALKKGEIDFIIGTHRLLSKDVEFKDLGLLVLDEEQRFGVEHKEKIKLLKKNVDALTLTATPIPRTLHMSLSGIRSISVINTPPKKRLPVQTYVTEETDALIKDVITREVNRGGQVFILYNRVESIFSFSEKVRSLLPALRITVVHGQMDEGVMEKNILAFYRGESDALISTTIIENGIDLPKANSLIVIDADRLGLSTLYQLKGRVGRSDRLAYAYFTFKRDKILSETAFGRLYAITEFTEMGSGIKIAMRDLEIRGAGNILGAEQHGQMDRIGYELYSKLLREELSGKEEKIPDLDVRITAFIPDEYIENKTSRMDAYKEIAELDSEGSERELLSSLSEVYGEPPQEVLNLINISAVKRMAMKLSAESVTVNKSEASITFADFSPFADKKLQRALDERAGEVVIGMSAAPKLEFCRGKETNAEMLCAMREFLKLATEPQKEKGREKNGYNT